MRSIIRRVTPDPHIPRPAKSEAAVAGRIELQVEYPYSVCQLSMRDLDEAMMYGAQPNDCVAILGVLC